MREHTFCTVVVDAGIAIVTLRARGKANRMGPDFWSGMPELFAELDSDDEVRAVILRGEGENFTYGLDLATIGSEFGALVGDGALARERLRLLETIERMQRATSCVVACKKPVIAAIAGWCIGGGIDLATACDVRLCSRDARFSVREVKLAIVADMGTLARLPAIVGQGTARELAFSGDDIDAARALRVGLVTEVFETQASLHEGARALARRIADNSPIVVAGIKKVLNASSERAAADSLQAVAWWNAAFLSSHDLREAMSAFLEKRPPKFTGR